MQGVISPQVQDPMLAPVELHEVPLCLILQPDQAGGMIDGSGPRVAFLLRVHCFAEGKENLFISAQEVRGQDGECLTGC